MINIRNFCNSAIQHTKSTASLCAKAVGATAAGFALSNIVRISGLGTLISAVAHRMTYAALPVGAIDEALQFAAQKIVPPIMYYESDLKFPGCSIGRGWSYSCPLIGRGILAGVTEECTNRGLLQQKIIPWIAKKLPTSVGDVLNKKIVRIFLTSLLFAAGHENDVSGPFVHGMIWGEIAEITQSLKIPMLSHMMNNGFTMYMAANANKFGVTES